MRGNQLRQERTRRSLAAIYAALGGLIAIHTREHSGRGQVVDSAIYEAVLAMMESLVPEYQVAGHVRERSGAILPNIAPSNVYGTSDGKMIVIGANQDTVFGRLAEAMGRPELTNDPRYASHSARGQNQAELDALITEWTSEYETEQLDSILNEAGVPTGRIYRAPEMLEDPHFEARESIVRLPRAEFGEIAMQNVVPKLSETPGDIHWIGPDLGQHNADVYEGLLGMSSEDLALLQAEGVI